MKRNLHNAFLSFPVAGYGSCETINKENSILETELAAKENTFRFLGRMAQEMKEPLHFKANPEFFPRRFGLFPRTLGLSPIHTVGMHLF
jgi:hypothetical protein